MTAVTIIKQLNLISQIEIESLIRYTYTTIDWCSANTTLEITPSTNKSMLFTRIGFVTYNPAVDFPQTIKVQFYDGDTWINLINATGYAPLILGSSRIDSFKIGAADIIHISSLHRNSMILYSIKDQKLRFTASAVITGTDKFYAGAGIIEYK